MINLYYHDQYILVFDVEDWNTLRRNYRIIGEFIGTSVKNDALPLALTPEEAYLLIKKGVAQIVACKYNNDIKSKEVYDTVLNDLYKEEKTVLREERKEEISMVIDKIIQGKKNKGIIVSKEDVMKDEINKIVNLRKEDMITPTYTKHPEYLRGDINPVQISVILSQTSPIKCAIYEDLWEKGYFITTGRKFGGDFLVYLGDPIVFHALYIVKCIENPEKEFTANEIVMYGRLGNSVKKSFMLAKLNSDQTVKYITLSWMEC